MFNEASNFVHGVDKAFLVIFGISLFLTFEVFKNSTITVFPAVPFKASVTLVPRLAPVPTKVPEVLK